MNSLSYTPRLNAYRRNFISKNINMTVFKGSSNQNQADRINGDSFERQTKLEKGQFFADGKVFNRSCTNMFRIDLDWGELKNYIKKHFGNQNRVNTYIYGCADGSEAYTMSILLQNAFNDKACRFFPIQAKDIDGKTINDNIQAQKSEKMHIHNAEAPAREYLDIDSEEMSRYIEVQGLREYLLKQVTEPVHFSRANILEDLDSIDTKNPSIVMCRNMWSYINFCEYDTFAQSLYERLAKGSVIVIGSYDCNDEYGINNKNLFPKALLKAGFREPDRDEYNPEFVNDISHYTIFVKE